MASDGFTRDPEAYRPDPGGHFKRRKKERNIPPTAIRRCIESGDVIDSDNGRVKLRADYLQTTYCIVLDTNRMLEISIWEDTEP